MQNPSRLLHAQQDLKDGAPAWTWLAAAAKFLWLTSIFSLAYTQAPLYTSNQNQYFLHGLARAGWGFLSEDWLANTLDPTPLFSLFIYLSARFLHLEALFYVYYAMLLGIYLACLLGIIASISKVLERPDSYWITLAALISAHSAALRFGLSRLLGDNWTYVIEDGVADQRLLGTVFQPSAFGVLLVLSIYLFLRRRSYLAVLAATLAASIHPTYLLSAAALTLAYMLVTYLEGRSGVVPTGARRLLSPGLRAALGLGLTALVSVAPILLYVYTNFGSTPAETTLQARQILVDYRIPHHAQIGWWFDATAVVKILLVGTALFLIRKERLFLILLLPTLIASGLTIGQVLLGSSPLELALALIFPWRLSTFLVPISTAILLTWGVERGLERASERVRAGLTKSSLVLLALVLLVGAIRLKLDFARKGQAAERPMLAFVAAQHAAGETYLTPVKMQDFRLATGSPVYVEFKSIPYRDSDVLEWYRRMQIADRFYLQQDCSLLASLAQEGVTHVILETAEFPRVCPRLQPTYQDGLYGVFRLSGGLSAGAP